MYSESSSFSTANYSFHNDPPGNNEYNFNSNSPNFNDNYSYYYPSPIDFTDTAYDTELSFYTYYKDRAGGNYYPYYEPRVNILWNEHHTAVEIEFDEGVSPPCEDLPSEYICLESPPSISTVGSFDLGDTVLYPITGDRKIKRYTQELQVEDIDELKVFYKIRNYRSQKFCHPYKLYGFWNTDTAEEYKAAGGFQLLLDTQVHIELPTREYRKILRENCMKGFNEPKEPVFRNCFSVRPVGKSSLIVNQYLKRVCFSDITTYHSPPYDYSRTNKDPSKRLVIGAIRGKTQYNVVKRQ
jgi:hypothetical protein